MNKHSKTRIIILAAGKGTRMKSSLPKVLVPLRSKPMIKHLLETIHESGIDDRPIIVVGYEKKKVIKELGRNYDYAIQEEQLGTGHAVMSAEKMLKNDIDHIAVLYGDHPFISSQTIKKLVKMHIKSDKKITMATFSVPDFEGWRTTFYKSFSRIIRDTKGNIIKDVQFKDASDEEKEIKELNPCYFCFEKKWLLQNLKKLNTNNAQKEYYLTDLVKTAMKEKDKIQSISIDPREALGINSKEELEILEKFSLNV
jgi:bifunctional UDP-N-acetylglucosamine pyrophosphorylase/glucosamine-1-phosphate N-acetyltransferase